MNRPRLTIRELAVVNGSQPAATINFFPGLNLVVGASDTGKTFIFEAIDFMLGSKGPLKRIPESKGYTDVLLSLDPSSSPAVTLRRSFSGGDVTAVEYASGREAPATETRVLTVGRRKDPNSLSKYLLRAIGLEHREIRKNAAGAKQLLSFRNLCHVALIDEERIIQKASPVFTGQYTTKTAEESVFAFILTGTDDSSVVEIETKSERDARLAIQQELLVALLDEKRSDLAKLELGDTSFGDEAERMDLEIELATQTIVASQAEIAAHERRREELTSLRSSRSSRLTFVDEQAGRLRLLWEYYETDRARLDTLVQASRAFHTLPEGSCPFCNRTYDNSTGLASHQEFESACSAEIAKIDTLRGQLALAIDDFAAEIAQLRADIADLNLQLAETERTLEGFLTPSVATSQGTLESLIKRRSTLTQGLAIQSAVDGLTSRLSQIERLRQTRPTRGTFEKRTSTSGTTDLCLVVEQILQAWKYPNLGRVTYDPQKADLVIGGQDRGNKGKGYRAITYAAFAIALLKYCRAHDLPHPGFVILDTPLNPFKGELGSVDEQVSDEVKTAFFEYLANDDSGDQVIVMENEEPPAAIRSRINYHRFTKNRTTGRYGFFPVEG